MRRPTRHHEGLALLEEALGQVELLQALQEGHLHMLRLGQRTLSDGDGRQASAALHAEGVLLAGDVRLLRQAGVLLGQELHHVAALLQVHAVHVAYASRRRVTSTQQHEVFALLQRALADGHLLQPQALYKSPHGMAHTQQHEAIQLREAAVAEGQRLQLRQVYPSHARRGLTAQRQLLVDDRTEALLAEAQLAQVAAVYASRRARARTDQIDLAALLEAEVAQLQAAQLRQVYASRPRGGRTLADQRQAAVEAALTTHDLRQLGHRREVHVLHVDEVAAAERQRPQLTHYRLKNGGSPTRQLPHGGLLEGVLAELQRDQRGVARHVQRLALGEAVVTQLHALQVLAACASPHPTAPTRDLQLLALRHGGVLEGHGGHRASRNRHLRHGLEAVLGEVQRRQVAHSYGSAGTRFTTLEDQCVEAGTSTLLRGHLLDGAVYDSERPAERTVEHQRGDGLGQCSRQNQGVEHVVREDHRLQGLDVAEAAQELAQQFTAVHDVIIVRS